MKKIICMCLIILGCSDDIAPTVEITYPSDNDTAFGCRDALRPGDSKDNEDFRIPENGFTAAYTDFDWDQ